MSESQSMTERALMAVAEGQSQYNTVQRDRRDRLAAAALTGLLARTDIIYSECADIARDIADLLILTLDKPRKPQP